MASQSKKTIMLPALGRPFSLGMLYDCRQDSLLPGLTLWDREILQNHVRERPKSYNDFEILSSESTVDKTSALNVEASLKVSFFSGLVEVEGSAKYLHDDKTSTNQARVTLKYEATTKFHELSMEHLGRGNMKFPYVFEQDVATHVVTGILYGAQAFLVFDSFTSGEETQQDIEGSLRVMIRKIPSLVIEGSGSVKMSDEDKKTVQNFSCKFHGDFLLQKTPTNFEDSVGVYQSLPTLLGEHGEKAIPVKVWLLPLESLDSSAAKLVREISAEFVEDAQAVLVDLKEVDLRCNAVLKTATCQSTQVSKKIKVFKEMCSQFTVEFQRKLATILPLIRGGGEEESMLADLLLKRKSSPFNQVNLNEWLDCKEREVDTLTFFSGLMKNTRIVPSQIELFKEVLSVEHAICFVFTSLGRDEPYLSALSDHLRGTKPADPDSNSQDVEKEQWYASKEVLEEMRKQVKLFSDFAEANQEEKNMKFLTVGLTDEEHKGSTIYLYKDGFTVSQNFEPPSQPESVTAADRSHNSVTLKISPPRFGAENVTSYSVEFCVRGEDGWKQQPAPTSGDVTVRELSPNTEYVFRCRAGTSAGVGPAHVVPDPIKTLPCSPPGEPHVEPNICELSVTWKKPAKVGQNVKALSYIMEYALKEDDDSHLHWTQITSDRETVSVSELPPNTHYVVRVTADCGEAGRSKESITVSCATPDTHLRLLQEILPDFPRHELWFKTALGYPIIQEFPQIRDKLKTMKTLCVEFKQLLLQKLKETVPSSPSKAEQGRVIATMTDMRRNSPFNKDDLETWTVWRDREIHIIRSLTQTMKNTEIVSSQYLFEEKIRSSEQVMSFVFTSLGDKETYLSAMYEFIDRKAQEPLPRPPGDNWTQEMENILSSVSQKATRFSDFAEANQEKKNIKFLTVGLTDEEHKGSTIYLYKDGFTVSQNFEPPSQPESVTAADRSHNSVTLKISPPRFGAENVTSYSVEFCVCGEDGWKQQPAPTSGDVTVRELSPNTEYVFRCRAGTSAGVGPACEVTGKTEHIWVPHRGPPTPADSSKLSRSDTTGLHMKPADLMQD